MKNNSSLKRMGSLFLASFLLVGTLWTSFKVFPVQKAFSQTSKEEDDEKTQEEADNLEEQIKEYEDKLKELGTEGNSLQKEIEYANSQIQLTQLRIQNTINQIAVKTEKIAKLGEDIVNLANRIDKMVDSIAYQENILAQRKRSYYKMEESTPTSFEFILFLLDPKKLEQKIDKTTYSEIMQEHDNNLLKEMNKTKIAYTNQKNIFEDKKQEEEKLKAEIVVQKANQEAYKRQLDDQKASKERLLKDTQNSEAKYQELLEEARKELESYAEFVVSSGVGLIGPNGLGGGEGGWYFSQRDSRWADEKIGNSSYTIFRSGCLVTSVAMVHNYYGYDVTPEDIGDRDEYFIFGDMRIPWPAPKNKSYKLLGGVYPKSEINKELDDGNPVIIRVYANNAAGTHFLVLAEEDDGDYIMYDPLYGPDLNFSDYYSTSSISQAVVFK